MPLPPPERPAEQASVQVVSRSPLGVQPETSNDLNFTMVSELLAEPDERVSWIVDGLLPSGGLSLLAGKPKAGKSTLARCLALSVARGLPVIGRDTVAGPVIYVALEDKRSEVKKHLREMGAGREAFRLMLAERDDNGLLNVVAECLDRLLVIPNLGEEERSLYDCPAVPRRSRPWSWWRTLSPVSLARRLRRRR